MDYKHFEIRNKHTAPLGMPVRTSGTIGSWTDAYIRNGFYIINLRDKRKAEDKADVTYDIGCRLPVQDGKILGFELGELNKLMIVAARTQQNVAATGILGKDNWLERILGREILFVESISFG